MEKRDATIKAKPAESDWSPNSKWTIKDLQSIFKPLKRKEDGAMPTKKDALLILYGAFHRENRVCIAFDSSVEDDNIIDTNADDVAPTIDGDAGDSYCEI